MHSNIPKSIFNKSGRIFIIIKAKPGSKKEGITGFYKLIIEITDDFIGINIKAQPVDGEANKAIIRYLSDIFGVYKSDVIIEIGGTRKNKVVSLNNDIKGEEIITILEDNRI
jgi:uncharacterized protein (TIGR00251 family)